MNAPLRAVEFNSGQILDPEGFNELKLCRSGPMIYNKNDVFIGRSMQKYGEFSWYEIDLFQKIIEPGMMAVDAGANIGTHTIEMSRSAAVVVAFEPQRVAYQTLCANMAINNRTNVLAFNAALGATNGLIAVPVLDQGKPNNFGGVVLEDAKDGEIVDLFQLDRFEMGNLGFIKADLEGMERDMLIGAEKTIVKHRPVMYLETEGLRSKETREILFDLKYDCYWHCPPMFNEDNFFGMKENIFVGPKGEWIISINMLCVPAEKNIVIKHFPRVASTEQTWDEARGLM